MDKKELTKKIIDTDIRTDINPIGVYFGSVLWIAFIFWFATTFNPALYLCGIVAILMFLGEIKNDIKRRKLNYYIIERECIDKEVVLDDEDPDKYRLWFLNKEKDWKVSIYVEKNDYDQTEINELFYLVFFESNRLPCKLYRCNEWTLKKKEFLDIEKEWRL